MKKFLMILAVLAMSCMFVPAVVRAATESQGEEATSFSNQDLEKYKSPDDNASAQGAVRVEKMNRTAKRDEQREKENWCSRARECQKKIDRAKDELKDEEDRTNDDSGTGLKKHKMRKQTRRNYVQARKKLREAERDLSYLEEEAHRKDIPPGWLRCQFE
jgi:hypothetical protein